MTLKLPPDLNALHQQVANRINPDDAQFHGDIASIQGFPLIQGKQALYLVDWKVAKVVYSRGLLELLGYAENEITTGELINAYHPDDMVFVNRIMKGVVNHFLSNQADVGEDYLNLTYRMRRKDGSYVKVLRQSSSFSIDTNGRPITNLSLLTDISFISNNDKVEWDIHAKKFNRQALREHVYQEFINFFTDRELDVVRCLAQGMKTGEIAAQLHISKHTVSTHRKNILSKSNCSSANELLQFCRANGIL